MRWISDFIRRAVENEYKLEVYNHETEEWEGLPPEEPYPEAQENEYEFIFQKEGFGNITKHIKLKGEYIAEPGDYWMYPASFEIGESVKRIEFHQPEPSFLCEIDLMGIKIGEEK